MQILLLVRVIPISKGLIIEAGAVTCDKCEHGRAYFYQLQIRSADEPMTTCKSLPTLVEKILNFCISSLPV